MANFGLLGALGGLGQAATNLGESIIQRRERALAEARRMAEEQRKSLERKAERKEEHGLRLAEIGVRHQGEVDIVNRQSAARRAENLEKRTYDVEDREDTQTHELEKTRIQKEGEERLARLRASLDEDKEARNTRLREALDDKDLKYIKYGKPYIDPDTKQPIPEYRQVIKVMNNGKLIYTNSYTRVDDEKDKPDDALGGL